MIHYTLYNKKINKNTIICLDTESTSFWMDPEGKYHKWDKNIPDSVYNEEWEKGSVVYIWMIGVDDTVYYGRELQELQGFLKTLEESAKLKPKEVLTIYVHNLAWDFQFLLNLDIPIDDLFARQLRKVMKFRSGNIVFKCSYTLENLNLASWGKQIGVKKLVGELDYNMLRTPKTPLFDYELDYCEHDILVMLAGLKKELEHYGSIKKIPLTATGKVRKVVQKLYQKDVGYLKKMTRCLPKSADEYKVSHQIQSGGDTHANAHNVGRVFYHVASKDECSAYPYYMLVGGYPVSPFYPIKDSEHLNFKVFCYIFYIRLRNIKSINCLSYLASSRCVCVRGGVYDNGRIHEAEEVTLYCTEVDLPDIIYYYGLSKSDIEFISIRKANKGSLNRKYIEYILQLFHDKSTLKGVEGMQDLYMRQKASLNSLFGMMMTDIIQSKIVFDGELKEWKPAVTQWEQDIQGKLDELQEKWYKNFVSYNQGAWVTAQARAGLWEGIKLLDPEDVLYYDTDSIKYLHPEKYENVFNKLNAERWKKIEETAKRFKLNIDDFTYINEDSRIGKSHLGAWEYDGEYKKFKTLGAKKYCYELEDGLHITVSGVPKSAVRCLDGDIDNFMEGFKFDADTCRKGLATYLDGTNITGVLWDGYLSTQSYGCNLRNCGYTLGLSGEFEQYLQYMYDYGNI